jgi:hypothetical protein
LIDVSPGFPLSVTVTFKGAPAWRGNSHVERQHRSGFPQQHRVADGSVDGAFGSAPAALLVARGRLGRLDPDASQDTCQDSIKAAEITAREAAAPA